MKIAPARNVGLWLAVLALMLLALAACGDNGDDGDAEEQQFSDQSDETAESESDAEPTNTTVPEPIETEEPEGPADSTGEEEESVQQPSMQWDQPPEMQLTEGADYQAVLKTNRGEVTINLLQDEVPKTVNNFVFLAEQGFYANVPFHRVISGFMIQTGDPTGTGAGGPGYRFEDEEVTRAYTQGTVAMANAGPNTNGSQFFIVHGDLSGQLPPNYTIFGEVVDGMDVVNEIANVNVQPSRSGEMSSPTEDVFVESVEIRS
ncbi:MAG: peptidylprolyl isomerase [Thermomicrobiaceae bacterium]